MLGYQGLVTDASALAHITSSDHMKPSFAQYLTNRLQSLELPSMYLYTAVVSVSSSDNTLDAMRLMSEYGVSSVAVLEEGSGRLLSAISVTDVGKVLSGLVSRSSEIFTLNY
jgi:CBS domain-containing protein